MTPEKRVDFLGCPVDGLTVQETLDTIERIIAERDIVQHVVINAAKFVNMRRDPELRRIILSCDMIQADGMSIVWAGKILGIPIPERINGTNLMHDLVALAAAKGYRIFFFGAREPIVKKVVEVYREKHPDLRVAGCRNGYYTEEEELRVAEMIRDSRADILFVGITSPKKEQFLNKWKGIMDVPFSMGVGGSFDVVAGEVKRAPEWMQRWCLEWFFRLLQEPGRMWKRYLVTNSLFIWIVLRARVLSLFK